MKRAIFAIGLASASVLGACRNGGASIGEQLAEQEPLVFQGVYHEAGSSWPVECYGPVREVTAKSGDILLRLVLNNTHLVQPAAIDRLDVPQKVYTQAIADMNNLESPDKIVGGNDYKLPDRCQPQ